MKRILLATIGSLGDLHPILALAVELQRRGHHVRVATAVTYRARIEAAGLAFAAIGPENGPDPTDNPALMARIMDLRHGPAVLIRDMLMPGVAALYEQMLPLCRESDLLITGEIVFPAPLLSEQLGLPWVSVILSPSSFLSTHDPSVMPPAIALSRLLRHAGLRVNRAFVQLAHRATLPWTTPIAALRAELGLKPAIHPLLRDKFSPYLTLALFSPHLAQPQPDWPQPTEVTGFVFFKDPAAVPIPALDAFLAAGPPPIVFTLGSAAVANPGDFYLQSIRIARQLGRRSVLLIGNNWLELPAGSDVYALPYAPYAQVFAAAAAVVHQGGIGTTAECLRAGVPQLILPHAFDQPDNAARVERLGLGHALARRRYGPAKAVPLLRDLLTNPAIQAAAVRMRARVEAENGLYRAMEAINRLLAADV